MTPHEPMTVAEFIAYASWFGDRYGGEQVTAPVTAVATSDNGDLCVRTSNTEWRAAEVVVATGIGPFPSVPDRFAEALGEEDPRVHFAIAYDGAGDAGRRVAVVGAGQSALEAAAAAIRSGAETTLLVRSAVRWFADREPSRPRGALRRRAFELAYPAIGYGPPPLNRLVLHPDLFARLPVGAETATERPTAASRRLAARPRPANATPRSPRRPSSIVAIPITASRSQGRPGFPDHGASLAPRRFPGRRPIRPDRPVRSRRALHGPPGRSHARVTHPTRPFCAPFRKSVVLAPPSTGARATLPVCRRRRCPRSSLGSPAARARFGSRRSPNGTD